MDKYTLKIVAFAKTDLEEKILKIPDPERMTTVFSYGKSRHLSFC